MAFIKEFREFALKGNVVDLAVAVIIGAAFGAIVSSLVTDIITPLLLTPALEAAHVNNLKDLAWGQVKYGSFLAAVLNFLVIALAIFMMIKGINSMKRKKEAKAAEPAAPEYTLQEKLLMEIRDSLKK
jgi:large conductance mechanosensitive channel